MLNKLLSRLIGQKPKEPEKIEPPEPPKWRLVPDGRGTYTLEEWTGPLVRYRCREVRVTPDEAGELIKQLDRDTLYYREESHE